MYFLFQYIFPLFFSCMFIIPVNFTEVNCVLYFIATQMVAEDVLEQKIAVMSIFKVNFSGIIWFSILFITIFTATMYRNSDFVIVTGLFVTVFLCFMSIVSVMRVFNHDKKKQKKKNLYFGSY